MNPEPDHAPVAFFVTCLADNFYPRGAIAAVRVLEHFGCRVEFPEAQTCCGQPMFNNGLEDAARDLARRMIAVFEPYAVVVTPSGSCAAMVREYYPSLFAAGSPERSTAERLAGRTYEFVEYLTRVLRVDFAALNLRWAGDVTYHWSCHLRGLHLAPAAVEGILRQIEGCRYASLEKIEQCCGFGGTFAMKFADVSGAMVRDKVECIGRSGATRLVSNDAGCTMNIAGACRRQGVEVEPISIAEILAEALGLMESSAERRDSHRSAQRDAT